ncbi:MAG: flagellin N-terminal helical domain-containing protein [Methylobacter sp.]
MAQTINTNISSLNAQRNLNMSQASLSTSLQRLSSGLRINSAKDDAAGLAISERFTTQIRGNDQAARNANDGISLAQSAEGDLVTIASNLQRMRELAVQSANATNSDSDRKAIDGEVQALSAEIDRVAQNSSFNGSKLLDGSFTAKNFHVGANNTASDTIQISAIASARTSSLGGVGATSSATITGTATTGALTAGALTLNGQQVGASSIGSAPGQSTASAFSIAAAINGVSADSGVTATANTNTVSGAAATVFTAIAANTFNINGVDIGAVAAGTTAAGQGANVAAAINLVATQTGVSASADATTGALTLTATDGRDINIGLGGSDLAANVAANKAAFLTQTGLLTANVGTQADTAAVVGGPIVTAAVNAANHGTVTLNSSSAAGIVYGGSNAALAGLSAAGGTVAATTVSTVSSIASVNVLTAANATSALDAIDGALQTVNTSRAALGAFQNRFATVVDSLQVRSENLSASKSRITDADFAKETANLTRAQILQQAGTAMLSQANQLPQNVLSLLR